MITYPPLWDDAAEKRVRETAEALDLQPRPSAIQFCKRCVVSNQRPRIVFDDEGVCSACRYAETKRNAAIDWEDRHDQLDDILLHAAPVDAHYNVIVPGSGGKDSSFVAGKLRFDYGMRPLVARWAPMIPTEIGRHNFDRFVHAGFDAVTCHAAGPLHRKLARLAFEFYGDPFMPFVYGQMCWPMHMALNFGISLVMFGENGEAEYGGDPTANDRPCWDMNDWDRVYNKGADVRGIMAIGRELGVLTEDEIVRATPFYQPPDQEALFKMNARFHWLGYYLPWHPQGNFYYAAEHTGFQANDVRSEGTYSKYASLDDKMDGLHYYMAYAKFGIGRATSDAAHEVRDGEITRDEAVALVRRFDHEFPTRHLKQCLQYLNITDDYLHYIVDRFRPPHVWERMPNGFWRLRRSVYERETETA